MSIHRRNHIWIIVFVLLLVWTGLLFRMNEPFWGHMENPPVWMGAAVRTYYEFGADAVNFLVVSSPGPTTPEDGIYYMHHPPLIVWLIAIATPFFGVDANTLAPHESTVRMVGYIATMLSLPLFYVLVRRLTNPQIALIAFLIHATTPFVLYFGRAPHYDIMLFPFLFAFLAVFINWMRAYTHQRTIILALIAVFAMWIDFPAAFYFAFAGVIALIYGKTRQRVGIIGIGIITILATIAIPVMFEILRPGTIGELLEIFELRSSSSVAGPGDDDFTAVQFLAIHFRDMVTISTLVATIFGTIGLIKLTFERKTFENGFILGLVVTPYVFMSIVPNSFYFHDWYEMHFFPAFVIAGAIMMYRGWQTAPDTLPKRYIKPFIVAFSVMSVVVSGYWLINAHQTSINNTFGRTMADRLPQYTEVDDQIASNVSRGFDGIEFYAYRTVIWGIVPDATIAFIEAEEMVDLHYVYCVNELTEADDYDPRFDDFDYVQVTEDCRLITINTGETDVSDTPRDDFRS